MTVISAGLANKLVDLLVDQFLVCGDHISIDFPDHGRRSKAVVDQLPIAPAHITVNLRGKPQAVTGLESGKSVLVHPDMIFLAVKAGTVTVYAVNHDAFENHFAFDGVKPVDLSLEVRTGIAAVEAHLKIIAAFAAGAHLHIKVLIIGSELPMCNLVDAVRAALPCNNT